jgi:DNA-binding NarL/FixJ family response regulator
MNADVSRLRILLIDDHALFREGVTRVLAAEPDLEIEHCASIAEALEILQRMPVDIVLLDYDLGFERGTRFLPAARSVGFSGRVLVVTAWVSDNEARRLVRQGVAGIFLKENPISALAEAIRAVGCGGAWLDQRYLRLLAGAEVQAEGAEPPKKLSERERAVLRYLLEGLTNKEIASAMLTSETSVKTILQRLFLKTGVRARGQLVRVALEQYRDLL